MQSGAGNSSGIATMINVSKISDVSNKIKNALGVKNTKGNFLGIPASAVISKMR